MRFGRPRRNVRQPRAKGLVIKLLGSRGASAVMGMLMLALGSSEASAQVANVNYDLKSAVQAASVDPAATMNARQSMTILLGRQDAALFDAAETSQQGGLLAALLLGLTVIAAATLVVPMAWLYIRYKRGATIEVKL